MTITKAVIKRAANRTLGKPTLGKPNGRARTDEMKRAVVERVLAAWQKLPDLRLSQFIINATSVDPFYVEDEHLAAACERYVKGEK